MNNNLDAYKLLEVPKNFTLEQLKTNYKRIALRLHPDKNGGNDYLFKLITNAYKYLVKEFHRRQHDKPFDELKSQYTNSPSTSQEHIEPALGSGANFNSQKFNRIFETTRLEDINDDGYGHWMEKSSGTREDFEIKNTLGKFNQNNFNNNFEKLNKPMNKHVIKYQEPEPLLTTKKMSFAELGVSNIDDFSNDNLSNKTLNFMDYKIAHTTNRLVDSRHVAQRKDYKTIDDIEADRYNISYQMSDKDLQLAAKKQLEMKKQERLRQENIKKRDELIAKQYAKLNYLLTGKSL